MKRLADRHEHSKDPLAEYAILALHLRKTEIEAYAYSSYHEYKPKVLNDEEKNLVEIFENSQETKITVDDIEIKYVKDTLVYSWENA